MFQKLLDKYNGPGTLEGKFAQGVVIDNNDPQQLQRVKVRVAELHSGRPPEEIPWSLQFMFSKQGHTSNVGSIAVPIVGAKVLITFPEDDEHDTYYVADYHDKSTKISELLVDYPNSYGHIDASGNLFLVNTKQDTITLVHLSGSYVTFQKNGAVEVAAMQDLKVYAGGNMHLRAGGNIYIDGSNVYLNGGGATTLNPTARTKPGANQPVNNDY